MRSVPEALLPLPVTTPSRSSRPLVLESSELDDSGPLGGIDSRSKPESKRTPITPQTEQGPTRRPRFFGLIPGQATAAAPASKAYSPGRKVVSDDLRDDPAVESALKRRIERQVLDMVGNRARSIEVKIVGKEATVQVGGVKFLQKRAVRKQLEGLPALTGLRSTIEVND